jgi:hypothetical protein
MNICTNVICTMTVITLHTRRLTRPGFGLEGTRVETAYNKRHGGSSSLGVSTPRYGLASQGPARKRRLGAVWQFGYRFEAAVASLPCSQRASLQPARVHSGGRRPHSVHVLGLQTCPNTPLHHGATLCAIRRGASLTFVRYAMQGANPIESGSKLIIFSWSDLGRKNGAAYYQ